MISWLSASGHTVRLSLTCLILSSLTEVHDDLGGAGVEGVEVRSVVIVQARGREVIDTPQSVHQLPAQGGYNVLYCRIQYRLATM